MRIDFNCDMGEGMNTDEAIMPYISSANIACGYHAGDRDTIKSTIENCLKHAIKIGAHPSFLDRENFGRKEMNIHHDELYNLIVDQLVIIQKIAGLYNTKLYHVKPHGALYNMAARNSDMSKTIVKAVYDFDPALILYGLSESCLIQEAHLQGLRSANEVFADRTYQDDGSLTPRSHPLALIEDADKAINQAFKLVTEQQVVSVSGKKISFGVDTLCIHGDGSHAVSFAKKIYTSFINAGIEIKHL